MKLHILGLPHTITKNEFSHCAYTGKVLRFPEMMESVGYDVFHYGVEGAETKASRQIDVLMEDEWRGLRQQCLSAKYPERTMEELDDPTDFVGDLADVGTKLYRVFNQRLRYFLNKYTEPGDAICLPFGHGHSAAVEGFLKNDSSVFVVESGIGYPDSFCDFRVFESYAWYHHEIGRRNMRGHDYWFVVPNYFDEREWEFNENPTTDVVYFGRISQIKGLDIVREFAKHRPDITVTLCGQGDPSPYLDVSNIRYKPPISGLERSDFLGSAKATIMPTRYVEPFGGVTVESQLCGTPVLGGSYGSFTETIEDGVTGFRCRTLGDFLAGHERIEDGDLDRAEIARIAREKYDMFNVAHQYDQVFQQLKDLSGKGWYEHRSKHGPVTRAVHP